MHTRRHELGPGTATALLRPGLAVLVCDDAFPPELRTAIDEADAAPGGWQELGRELGDLLGAGASLPAFGAVAVLDDGVLVFLAGAVVATLTAADGHERRLSGVEVATWLDRVVDAEQASITLAPEGQPVPADPSPYAVVEGVVPAGWVRSVDPTVTVAAPTPAWPTPPTPPSAASHATPPPAPTVAPSVPTADPAARAADPTAGAAASGPSGPPPPPVAATGVLPPTAGLATTPPTAPPAATGRATMAAPRTAASAGAATSGRVEGILCPWDHLNAPDAAACRDCGEALGAGPHDRVERDRPSLGFLVLDDGAAYALDGRYVLGREPDADPLVAAGDGRPIVVDDPQRSVSRVHAEVRLVGWDVQLLDRGSTNGTYVLRGDVWEPVSGQEPRLISPGTRMAVGQRTFVYEAARPV
ncbi:MAG: FHA domain-containing protein [Nitriliruptoraceae bacterium]